MTRKCPVGRRQTEGTLNEAIFDRLYQGGRAYPQPKLTFSSLFGFAERLSGTMLGSLASLPSAACVNAKAEALGMLVI